MKVQGNIGAAFDKVRRALDEAEKAVKAQGGVSAADDSGNHVPTPPPPPNTPR